MAKVNLLDSLPVSKSPYFMMGVKLAISGVLIFGVLGFYFFYISPTLESQELQINEMADAEVQNHQLAGEISELETQVASLKAQHGQDAVRFFKPTELILMNRKLNEFARDANVRMVAMKVNPEEELEKKDGGQPFVQNGKVLEFSNIPVTFQIKGDYLNYLAFRAQLAGWEKAVNIKRETITAGQGRYTGIVTVAGVLQVVQAKEAEAPPPSEEQLDDGGLLPGLMEES